MCFPERFVEIIKGVMLLLEIFITEGELLAKNCETIKCWEVVKLFLGNF